MDEALQFDISGAIAVALAYFESAWGDPLDGTDIEMIRARWVFPQVVFSLERRFHSVFFRLTSPAAYETESATMAISIRAGRPTPLEYPARLRPLKRTENRIGRPGLPLFDSRARSIGRYSVCLLAENSQTA
ncbi:hypothetical protein [Nocardia sp. NBC_01327]|uniref:hypothetical protein n=1 Tax=Nocardia sp. NBC_01327 TaxID=2903593 RepID=UPI002E134E37|nr:hypothetical protein OG326_30855 [Nocardia sp. NBC_01327]